MRVMDEKQELTDKIKESVLGSGALANLKNVSTDATDSHGGDVQELKQQAQGLIDDIAQKLNSGKLDDSTSIKLSALILKLQGALHKSPSALATALSEALAAIGDTGNGAGMSAQQKTAQLWQRVDADNKAIDDDFAQMRGAGVTFNDRLWGRHKELAEYLQTHPHDLKTQKELDAVDDALLMQAQPQLEQCPDAKQFYDDAKKKSDDRHQAVDKDLAKIEQRTSFDNPADSDWGTPRKADTTPVSSQNISMNDVTAPPVGQKSRPVGKQHS